MIYQECFCHQKTLFLFKWPVYILICLYKLSCIWAFKLLANKQYNTDMYITWQSWYIRYIRVKWKVKRVPECQLDFCIFISALAYILFLLSHKIVFDTKHKTNSLRKVYLVALVYLKTFNSVVWDVKSVRELNVNCMLLP